MAEAVTRGSNRDERCVECHAGYHGCNRDDCPCAARQHYDDVKTFSDVTDSAATTVPHDFNRCRCDQLGRCLVHCRTCDCVPLARAYERGSADERRRSEDRITALENALHAYAPWHDLLEGDNAA